MQCVTGDSSCEAVIVILPTGNMQYRVTNVHIILVCGILPGVLAVPTLTHSAAETISLFQLVSI
jgi:hypothetical protein